MHPGFDYNEDCPADQCTPTTSSSDSSSSSSSSSIGDGDLTCGNGFIDAGEECDEGANNGPDQRCHECRLTYCGDAVVQDPNGRGESEQCEQPKFCNWSQETVSCTQDTDCRKCVDNQCSGWKPENANDTAGRCTDDLDCQVILCKTDTDDPLCDAACKRRVSSSSSSSSSLTTSSSSSAPASSGKSSATFSVASAGSERSTIVAAANEVEVTPTLSFCGNEELSDDEQCDDGNRSSGDGCSAECRLEPNTPLLCGDAIITQGEQCDQGSRNSDTDANRCRTTCRLPGCGDRVVDYGEACDDGNTRNGDACSDDCSKSLHIAASAICGNGTLEKPEECDDGNRRDSDGCNSTCLLEIGICGDGVVQKLLGEQCEQATHDIALPYDCRDCLTASRTCGDGKLDPGEECDDGSRNDKAPNANCRPDCHAYRCGDGVTDSGETCDDGNRRNGDGCDSVCISEETQIAGERIRESTQEVPFGQAGFPFAPNVQALPFRFPLAQMQPLLAQAPQATETGPAAVAVIGAGAAAGWSWMRRRKK